MEADSLYAGIMIDTNNFMTKAGVRTFEAAAFLKTEAERTSQESGSFSGMILIPLRQGRRW